MPDNDRICFRCDDPVPEGEEAWADTVRARIWHKDCLTCADCGGELETHEHAWGSCLRCTECGHLWRVGAGGSLHHFPYKISDSVEDAPYNV